MMRWDEIFEEKQPPGGGLARLRARIRSENARRYGKKHRWQWALAVTAVICLLVLWPNPTPPAVPQVQLDLSDLTIHAQNPARPVVTNGSSVKVLDTPRVIYFRLVRGKAQEVLLPESVWEEDE